MTGLTVELPAMPPPGALYRHAAFGVLRRRRTRRDQLPDTTFVVRDVTTDRARLAGYEQVCAFGLSDQLPATYPHILAFPLAMHLMNDETFPFPMIGLVHIGNAITQVRPLGVEERLDMSVRTGDLRVHDRGRQFDLIATASVDGVEVWRDVSTYLRREPAAPARSGSGRGAGSPRVEVSSPAGPGVVTWPVGRDVGKAYAAISGDRNPIHVSRLGARLLGFRGPIAHGMWTMARCLAGLAGRLPDAYTADVTFQRPILAPSTVSFTATNESGTWNLELRDARTGAPHLRGSITPVRP